MNHHELQFTGSVWRDFDYDAETHVLVVTSTLGQVFEFDTVSRREFAGLASLPSPDMRMTDWLSTKQYHQVA